VLNLFAYTGGSTLAAAAAGASVTHVDAAKNIVAWARRNAELSGLADAPIRWIAEDATTFVRREVRRGNRYDGLILDPPSYGHGPKGEVWKVERHLAPLLTSCRDLLSDRRAFLLLTCHSPGFGPAELEALLADTIFGSCQGGVVARELSITAADARKFVCGAVARWPG
jgi:23S rRNA (cytosine1962-C5)-methyltransferase